MELTCPHGEHNRIRDAQERPFAKDYSKQMTKYYGIYIDQFTVPYDPRTALERFNDAWTRFEAKYGKPSKTSRRPKKRTKPSIKDLS